MADTLFSPIDTLVTSPWTIKNASGTGNVDEYRMAISIGAQLTDWYGRRINALMDEVNNDAKYLTEMTAADTWTVANWNSGANYSTVAAWPASLGVQPPVGADMATVTLADGAYTRNPVPNQVFVPQVGPFILNPTITYPRIQWAGPPPAGQAADGTFFDYSTNRSWMPDYDKQYQSGDGYVFVRTRYASNLDSSYLVTSVSPYSTLTPTQAQLDAFKAQIPKAAGILTQNSQAKQAFLQDLTASMNKFFNWTSNILQRDEKNKQDILAKF